MKTLVQSKKGDKMQIRANQPAPLVALGYWQHGPKSLRFNLAIVAVFLLLICMLNSSSSAQTTNTGAVSGTITDPSGAVVANASVKVTNEATGDTGTVISGDRSNFSAPLGRCRLG